MCTGSQTPTTNRNIDEEQDCKRKTKREEKNIFTYLKIVEAKQIGLLQMAKEFILTK